MSILKQYKQLRDECETAGEGILVEIYDYAAQLEAELVGWKTEAENRKFIYEKAKAENERLREYIIEEVGIEHVPEEFGGKS